ncbi:MAG: M48 family metallopeptidase [Phycisphaeraceae bacterium]|nr:M48 family metallopeptidase [Phycisphaeraceae bacterium]MCW5762571.1 M48 family metallopeptidase [Phycisphaeraceae bacterium]
MKSVMKYLVVFVVGSTGLMLAGCSDNPTLGRSQFALLSRAQEIEIGEQAQAQLSEEYGGRVKNEAVQAYLAEVCMSMVAHTEGDWATLPWEFTLLDSPVINAFALPGGKTFMSRGLVEKLSNEAELAFIMGHEIGHVTARHGNTRISQQIGASVLLVGAGVAAQGSDSEVVRAGVPAVIGAGTGLYLLRYGRNQESESDALGMRYMVRAGYNPLGARGAMQVLADLSQGSERGAEMFATHPHPERRVADINERIKKHYSAMVDDPAYEFHEDRFRARMLRPLAMLPRSGAWDQGFALHETATWCGLCAAEALGDEHAAVETRIDAR